MAWQHRESPSLENRTDKRIDIRKNEGISASIRIDKAPDLIDCEVFDLSLSGLCVLLPESTRDQVSVGEMYNITVKRSWDVPLESQYQCKWKALTKDGFFKCGFSYQPENLNEFCEQHIDTKEVITTNSEVPVLGFIYKEGFYLERSPLLISSIGKKKMIAKIYDTEIFIKEGMEFKIGLSLMVDKKVHMACQVKQLLRDEKGNQFIFAEISEMPAQLEQQLMTHLLLDENINPKKLREAGFNPARIANIFKFRFISSNKQYNEVLKLRRKAYSDAGKIEKEIPLERMTAPLDHKSRIMAVYHGDKLVASVALTFPDSEDLTIDIERALPNGYPKDLPKKTKIIEISRLCTDPSYRKSDLLVRVFEHIYKTFAISDRDYLATSTDKKLWPLYKGIGFKKSRHTYLHPTLNQIPHTIITISKDLPTFSRGFSILRWNYLYKNMTFHLLHKKSINMSLNKRIRIKIYRWIGKILKIKHDELY